MSKLYDKYLNEKKKDKSFYYLFKSGLFYIFIDDDAKKVSSITTLKLTSLTNDIVKCGFPASNLNKYIALFKNLNLNFKIVENDSCNLNKNIINKINNLDLDTLTPIEALNMLKKFKDYINE